MTLKVISFGKNSNNFHLIALAATLMLRNHLNTLILTEDSVPLELLEQKIYQPTHEGDQTLKMQKNKGFMGAYSE